MAFNGHNKKKVNKCQGYQPKLEEVVRKMQVLGRDETKMRMELFDDTRRRLGTERFLKWFKGQEQGFYKELYDLFGSGREFSFSAYFGLLQRHGKLEKAFNIAFAVLLKQNAGIPIQPSIEPPLLGGQKSRNIWRADWIMYVRYYQRQNKQRQAKPFRRMGRSGHTFVSAGTRSARKKGGGGDLDTPGDPDSDLQDPAPLAAHHCGHNFRYERCVHVSVPLQKIISDISEPSQIKRIQGLFDHSSKSRLSA